MADNYRIVSQKQNTVISPTGTGFDDVWTITYQVTAGPSQGTTAVITVPESEHNAADVKEAIEAKIADLDAIGSL